MNWFKLAHVTQNPAQPQLHNNSQIASEIATTQQQITNLNNHAAFLRTKITEMQNEITGMGTDPSTSVQKQQKEGLLAGFTQELTSIPKQMQALTQNIQLYEAQDKQPFQSQRQPYQPNVYLQNMFNKKFWGNPFAAKNEQMQQKLRQQQG